MGPFAHSHSQARSVASGSAGVAATGSRRCVEPTCPTIRQAEPLGHAHRVRTEQSQTRAPAAQARCFGQLPTPGVTGSHSALADELMARRHSDDVSYLEPATARLVRELLPR